MFYFLRYHCGPSTFFVVLLYFLQFCLDSLMCLYHLSTFPHVGNYGSACHEIGSF
uniref:Uncharacterized protein n=1 Tax=Rhizophora mucronata TaxID=61149 RepID=A0A2P2NEW4_RHIMU